MNKQLVHHPKIQIKPLLKAVYEHRFQTVFGEKLNTGIVLCVTFI